MGNSVHRAIWVLRTFHKIYIPRYVEKYIVEELEEDYFPYGFGGGTDEEVLEYVFDFMKRFNAGEINICKTLEERTLERYDALKEDYLRLLLEMKDMTCKYLYGDGDDDLPF